MKYTTSEIENMTAATLRELATAYGVKGRSKMKVDELRAAVTVALNETGNMYVDVHRDTDSVMNTIDQDYAESFERDLATPVTKEHVAPAVAERNAFLLRQATNNVLGSAAPMGHERRLYAYATQNNSPVKITPAQSRRINKKNNKAHG